MKKNYILNVDNSIIVSVIIPSFNREDTVGDTIWSILNQNCEYKFEIIIGDDCSTDNVREVLYKFKKQFPEIIKLVFHNENIGLAANWATCVKISKGKYICNCDNDDYWHDENKLKLQVDFMEKNHYENVLITNHRLLNRRTGKISEESAWIDRSINLQQALFRGKFNFCNATLMYRATFLKEHINLNDYIRLQFTLQDWNTWVILAAYTNFTILPVSTATLCVSTTSVTRPSSYNQYVSRLSKEKECYKYVCSLFPDKLIYIETDYEIFTHIALLSLAYKSHDYSLAKKTSETLNKLGFKSIKTFLIKYPILFYIYVFLKGRF